jgi:sulfite reductase (NADPH) flavoprotein alpha-component
MLDENKKQIIEQIIATFSKEEVLWTSGYLAGAVSGGEVSSGSISTKLNKDITILYITETGNSKFLAGEIAKKLKNSGANVKVKASDQYRLNDFIKEKNLIVIASTHGEGEIPASGKKFFDHITQNELDLKSLNYFTIALGDTNYPLFCQSGKDIDARLEKLGAKKLASCIELDLDFEDSLIDIQNAAINAFSDGAPAISASPVKKKATKNEFIGEIVSNVNLNDIGSSKETHHIEIAVDDELHYEPGDSVGILIDNEELKVEGTITPRLYSIASSLNEHGNEVHLTVSFLRYVDKDGKEVEGLFSSYLSKLEVGAKVKFYISKNRQFKLPADNKDVIMVGPGTGVAPFRAFMAERNYRSAEGKNWLFFGERNFRTDFLYQTEWQDHLISGLLTKMDVAFSRDQKEKIYVQDRIRENSKAIYQWLENGAYFYICGDKDNMAQDVENCLIDVIILEGGKTKEQAQEYLAKLVESDRYLKDVY